MKKLLSVFVGAFVSVSATVTPAAAQGAVEVIAYESCNPTHWGAEVWEWAITCDAHVATTDGAKGAVVGVGVAEPALSPDGGRVAPCCDDAE